MNKYLKCLFKSVLAGFSIGLGALIFLNIENKIVGSLFFTVGLFIILNFNLNLYTGKICYVVEKKNYSEMPIILIGNFIGTWIISFITNLTRLDNLMDNANNICQLKLKDSLLSLFILSVLCNIMIYIAVEGYNKFENNLSKIISLFFGVTVFIICGFEHCVADMFYFNFAKIYSLDVFVRLFIIVVGNSIGGLISRLCLRRNN